MDCPCGMTGIVDGDRKAIQAAKNICGGCGAPLRRVGEIEERRGDEYECSRDSCGYVEWRMYGDTYYEMVDE